MNTMYISIVLDIGFITFFCDHNSEFAVKNPELKLPRIKCEQLASWNKLPTFYSTYEILYYTMVLLIRMT